MSANKHGRFIIWKQKFWQFDAFSWQVDQNERQFVYTHLMEIVWRHLKNAQAKTLPHSEFARMPTPLNVYLYK